jgi:hypothetical protein
MIGLLDECVKNIPPGAQSGRLRGAGAGEGVA